MVQHSAIDHTGLTGVPGQSLGTSDSPQFAGVNIGHASDTTLTRASAGVVAVEGTNLVKAGTATGSGLTMATARLLGRTTASSGAIEEISVGTGLSLSAGSLVNTVAAGATIVTCRKTGDESKSSTSYADSTSMSLAVGASKIYMFRFILLYSTNATSVGIKLALQGPSGAECYASIIMGLGAPNVAGATIYHNGNATTDVSTDLPMAEPNVGPGAASSPARIEGVIATGVTSGTLKLRHASETATATTIFKHSFGELIEIS